MADQPNNESPRRSQSERLVRREAQRRRIRRRRRVGASAALLTIAVATAIAVLLTAGNGSPASNRAGRAQAGGQRGRAKRQGSGAVRNATPGADWQPHLGPVPILEYHVLGSPPPGAAYPELYVTRPVFHRQMNWLEDHGFQAVTLEAVEEAWYHHGVLPPKPVVISFDDGYRPQFTYALPELRRHSWPGVLSLKAEGSDLYTSNVEVMIDAGWELAAHTIDHRDLTTLDADQLKEEVAGSRTILRREYNVPVADFCYPAGRFNATVIAAVEAAGYSGATTEIPGYADRDAPYELARFEILGSSGVSGMAADLASG